MKTKQPNIETIRDAVFAVGLFDDGAEPDEGSILEAYRGSDEAQGLVRFISRIEPKLDRLADGIALLEQQRDKLAAALRDVKDALYDYIAGGNDPAEDPIAARHWKAYEAARAALREAGEE